KYTAKQGAYNPSAGLFNTVKSNSLTDPAQVNLQTDKSAGQVNQYFDAANLQNSIFDGIKARTDEDYQNALDSTQTTMANAGLFRSGLNVANQQELEGQRMDALAKGWGDSATTVASLQNEAAIAQARYDTDALLANRNINATLAQYNADVQNAFKTSNFETLMNAAAQDQQAVNDAAQFNIEIGSVYDELAYKFMASLLDEDIKKYIAEKDYDARIESVRLS
ncbi:MAG: hypothetical protein AB7C95_08840, partial [Synergistaceae bacterium]